MMTIATTNALSIVRVPLQTATLPLLLLTSFATIATAIALSILRVEGDTAPLKPLLLTSFAIIATAIAYADASVVLVALLTVFKATCCCYRNCYDANCYNERVIASTRAITNCYAATATANVFGYNCYCDRLR